MMAKTMGDVPVPVDSVSRIPLEAFAGQCQRSMQPLVDSITYFSTSALEEDQVRQFLREPAQATPRSLLERIPPVHLSCSDSVFCTSNFKIHVAQMIFIAKNIR